MKTRLSAKRGLTLVEILLVSVTILYLFALMPRLLILTSHSVRLNSARVEIQRDARNCMEMVTRKLRQAQSTTIAIVTPAGQPPASKIVFTMVSGGQITFTQSGRRLLMTDAKGTRAISKNLRSIVFSLPDNTEGNYISVAISTEKSIGQEGNKAFYLIHEKIRVMN